MNRCVIDKGRSAAVRGRVRKRRGAAPLLSTRRNRHGSACAGGGGGRLAISLVEVERSDLSGVGDAREVNAPTLLKGPVAPCPLQRRISWYAGSTRSERPRASPEAGAGTVLAVGVCLLAGMLAVLLLFVGSVVGVKERTQDAADLAALGGAQVFQESHDGEQACAAAAAIVQRNRAELVECTMSGEYATVKARTVAAWRWVSFTAQATAGPADAPPE